MHRAHDHSWVIVGRGDLSGSVVCHAEAFFESMAAAEHSAQAIACPAGTVLEWSPGLTAGKYEPGGRLVPVPVAGAQLPGPRFTPPGRELVVIDTDVTRADLTGVYWSPAVLAALQQHYRLLYRDILFTYVAQR